MKTAKKVLALCEMLSKKVLTESEETIRVKGYDVIVDKEAGTADFDPNWEDPNYDAEDDKYEDPRWSMSIADAVVEKLEQLTNKKWSYEAFDKFFVEEVQESKVKKLNKFKMPKPKMIKEAKKLPTKPSKFGSYKLPKKKIVERKLAGKDTDDKKVPVYKKGLVRKHK